MSSTATLQPSAQKSGWTPGTTEGSVDVTAALERLSQSGRITVRVVDADRRRPSQKPHTAPKKRRALKTNRKTPEQRAIAALERRRLNLRKQLGSGVKQFELSLRRRDVRAANTLRKEACASFDYLTQEKDGRKHSAAKALEVIGGNLDRVEAAIARRSTIRPASAGEE